MKPSELAYLKMILGLFYKITQHSDENTMSVKFMARVVAPSFVNIAAIEQAIQFTELMISHYGDLF